MTDDFEARMQAAYVRGYMESCVRAALHCLERNDRSNAMSYLCNALAANEADHARATPLASANGVNANGLSGSDKPF